MNNTLLCCSFCLSAWLEKGVACLAGEGVAALAEDLAAVRLDELRLRLDLLRVHLLHNGEGGGRGRQGVLDGEGGGRGRQGVLDEEGGGRRRQWVLNTGYMFLIDFNQKNYFVKVARKKFKWYLVKCNQQLDKDIR